MSGVSPFDEQFELTHAVVWGGEDLTFCLLYVWQGYVFSKEQRIAPGVNDGKYLPRSLLVSLVAHIFASLYIL